MKLSLSLAPLAFCAVQLAQADDTATITVAFPNGAVGDNDVSHETRIETTCRASIIDVDPTATTFSMECSQSGSGFVDYCNMASATVVAGPKTFAMDAVVCGSIEQNGDCEINESIAVCEVSGTDSGRAMTTTLTQRISYVPVTVTGGVDKLPASELSSQTRTTTGRSTIPTKTTTDDDGNLITLTGTVTAPSTQSETEAAETTSTGAAARITGAAWAAGMAAVVLAV